MAFEIKQHFLTKNDCYKAGRKIKPKGIMVHSTGANNPTLKRYIQPDDGVIGANPNGNDWNRSGITKCVHGFIGKDKNGVVRTYQTLPWNHRGWHGGGSSNDTHISFEICEDGLNDKKYFGEIYEAAIELCVHLCKLYNFTEKDIICHSEGFKRGIASNHGDVMHWFPKHGKSMDTLRSDVRDRLNGKLTVTSQTVNKGDKKVQYFYTGGYSYDSIVTIHKFLQDNGFYFVPSRSDNGSLFFKIGGFTEGTEKFNRMKEFLEKHKFWYQLQQ